MSLHLLRPFARWQMPEMTLEGAQEFVTDIDEGGGQFVTPTRRRPRRVDELKGGSVFFIQKRHTLFRMPYLAVTERRLPGWWWIWMEPKVIPVEKRFVGHVRGWRYLKGADAPMDLVLPDDLDDDEMEAKLRELGVGE